MVVSVGTKSAVTGYVPAVIWVAAPPVRRFVTAPGTELVSVTVAACAPPLYVCGELLTAIVAVGVGGVLAEIYGDVAVHPAPVDLETARRLIGSVKGFAPMRGYRGLAQGDLEALAAIVVALSALAVPGSPVAEAEINPVIVRRIGEGAVAVDGLIVLEAVGAESRR